jgi:hypothetical protein
MKRAFYTVGILLIGLAACKEDEVSVFEKTADERAAEAIANLKADLVAPANGWRVKYKPEEQSGEFYVLMDFDENDKVTIKSDLGAEGGEYFEQTIPYRIDNSLGLELILETYSFFSFLFEQEAATFGAEYEFNFVNKTPDGALVFNSKTDLAAPTIILFEEASAADENLLGVTLASNLNAMANDLDKFTSSLVLTYQNKNLVLYISLNELSRTLTIISASLKSNTQTVQTLNFNTSYLIEGDEIIFDQPLQRTILGNAITIGSLNLNTIQESSVGICAEPITFHTYSGTTSANDAVVLETSLFDVNGASFANLSDFYFSPLVYIFDNGRSMNTEIMEDIAGALELHMYYGYDIGGGELLYGIGFVIQNVDGSITFALREFAPVLNGNQITFNFEPTITIFGSPTQANTENINIYLNALTQGNNTYVFKLNEGVYEFHNPCTGWSFVLIDAN